MKNKKETAPWELFSFGSKKTRFSLEDQQYMAKALGLAAKALGNASPDPVVGAIIVKNGKILSTGYHGSFASAHAETWAIQKAPKNIKGATLYVTLEPCSHFGNNPPCCTTIINAQIKRVVVAMVDPNPLVNGQGIKNLRDAGIQVDIGLMEKEAKRLNEFFIKYITKRVPFVILKSALSLDGRMAARSGDSKWISSPESRKYGHYLRSICDAVLVGVNTVIHDNPDLTPRLVKKKQPIIRVVVDALGRTPLSSHVCETKKAPTIIAVSSRCPEKNIRALEKKGCQVLSVESKSGRIDLPTLMEELGKLGISSLLIEGGQTVAQNALERGIVDKVSFAFAPKIIDGSNFMKEALSVEEFTFRPSGADLLVEGYLNY